MGKKIVKKILLLFVQGIKPTSKRLLWDGVSGADPGFFLGGGALVSCSTSTPINHIVFFCRIPVVLENCRSSQGWGGVHPLHPPPRSAPVYGQIEGVLWECLM